ncbi:MAG TPA: MucB/RseB C-terminal domain-containing protein [Steroidobacteraceae bacterium]|nr:MucB/RseB C-terminal domain-containing protein [Steroidobacteraceae bacterium]
MRCLPRALLPTRRGADRFGLAAMCFVASLCAALLIQGTARAAENDDPRSWLMRTDQALSKLNYEGVFVHEHGSDTETLRVIHRVGTDGVSERLLSMDGSGREFIRRGTQLTCYLPDKRTVLVERSSEGGMLLASLPRLDVSSAAQYDISELARTRASGRAVRVIAITPTDELRYGYRVWVDEASGMPLKTQLRSRNGEILEQLVFTDLRLPNHISDAELQPSVDARAFRWVHQDADNPTGGALSISWQAASLPPGFHMTASARQMLPGGPVEHLVFSDGMASVSVFIEVGRDPNASGHDDAATLGTSSAYATMVQGYRVTAVGEVPPETVRAIALSIRTAGPSTNAADTYSAMEHPLAPALRTSNASSIFDQAPGMFAASPPSAIPDASFESRNAGINATINGFATTTPAMPGPPGPASQAPRTVGFGSAPGGMSGHH